MKRSDVIAELDTIATRLAGLLQQLKADHSMPDDEAGSHRKGPLRIGGANVPRIGIMVDGESGRVYCPDPEAHQKFTDRVFATLNRPLEDEKAEQANEEGA